MNYKTPFGIVFYHFYDSKLHRGQEAISASDFEAILLHFKDNILPADIWYEKAVNNQLTDRGICLTFDDALLCQYNVTFSCLGRCHSKSNAFDSISGRDSVSC